MAASPDGKLDTKGARAIAFAIALLCAGLLLFIERGLFMEPPQKPLSAAEKAFAACFDKARADIDGMFADGLIDEEKGKLFALRAEARCVAEAEKSTN